MNEMPEQYAVSTVKYNKRIYRGFMLTLKVYDDWIWLSYFVHLNIPSQPARNFKTKEDVFIASKFIQSRLFHLTLIDTRSPAIPSRARTRGSNIWTKLWTLFLSLRNSWRLVLDRNVTNDYTKDTHKANEKIIAKLTAYSLN